MSTSKPAGPPRLRDAPPQEANATVAGLPVATIKEIRPKRRTKRPRITRPAIGSLYDIMRDHAGTSLYVLPICWTDLHTRLLDVRFVALDPISTPVPRSSQGCARTPPRPSQTAVTLSRELTTLLKTDHLQPVWKVRAMKNILGTLYPSTLLRPKSSADLDIYFGNRIFRKAVRIQVLWKHPDHAGASFDSAATRSATSFSLGRPPSSVPSSGGQSQAQQRHGPMLAYLDRHRLAEIRKSLFRIIPGPRQTPNTPVCRLQQLRSKHLIPQDADCDPHFVAVFLAMAQAHFYGDDAAGLSQSSATSRQSGRSGGVENDRPIPEFRDVTVRLITHADDDAEFIVYTAGVTAAFLQRFAQPTKAPQSHAAALDNALADGSRGMKISYVRVPIWPVLGLKERLGKALGRDIAGDLVEDDDEDAMETWESQRDREERMRLNARNSRGVKRSRGREALAEVLNSSFSEDDSQKSHSSDSENCPKSKRICNPKSCVNPSPNSATVEVPVGS